MELLTYIRSIFGNNSGPVSEQELAVLRKSSGKF